MANDKPKKENKKAKTCNACNGVGFNAEIERQCPVCDGAGVK